MIVSSQARALPPEKPPIAAKRPQASLLHHVLGIGTGAGEPARERVGVAEVGQHHAAEAHLIVVAAHAPHRRRVPLRSAGILAEIGTPVGLFPYANGFDYRLN